MSVNFSPTSWVDNSQPAITASQLNRIEKGIKDCAEAFNQSSAVYNFKGTLERYQELPNLGNEIGDTYNILNTGKNYAWNGVEWFEINVSLDITPFTEDYIIEQGVNGIWTYRKWASGDVELWANIANVVMSQDVEYQNSVYDNGHLYDLPFEVSDWVISGSTSGGVTWLVNAYIVDKNVFFRLCTVDTVVNGTVVDNVYVRINGKWK